MFSKTIEVTDEVAAQIREFAEASFRNGRTAPIGDPLFLQLIGFTEEEIKSLLLYYNGNDDDRTPEMRAAIARVATDIVMNEKMWSYCDIWHLSFENIKLHELNPVLAAQVDAQENK